VAELYNPNYRGLILALAVLITITVTGMRGKVEVEQVTDDALRSRRLTPLSTKVQALCAR